MFYRFSLVAAGALALAAASATAVEPPVYHVAGLPITPLQLAVIGSAGADQAASPVTLTLAGMPASPHQLAALTPRAKRVGQQALGAYGRGPPWSAAQGD
jgi:hypothetical protein